MISFIWKIDNIYKKELLLYITRVRFNQKKSKYNKLKIKKLTLVFQSRIFEIDLLNYRKATDMH